MRLSATVRRKGGKSHGRYRIDPRHRGSRSARGGRANRDRPAPRARTPGPRHGPSTALVAPTQRATGLSPIAIGNSQTIRVAPGPVQPAAGAGHAPAVDQLFADLGSSPFAGLPATGSGSHPAYASA